MYNSFLKSVYWSVIYIKFINFKAVIQWVLTNVYSHITTTAIKHGLSLSPHKISHVPLWSIRSRAGARAGHAGLWEPVLTSVMAFQFLVVILVKEKFSNFDEAQFFHQFLPLWFVPFCVLSRKYLPNSWSQRFSLLFSSRIFIVLAVNFCLCSISS